MFYQSSNDVWGREEGACTSRPKLLQSEISGEGCAEVAGRSDRTPL
jgi:hypothetical protein